jgi:hypothetical protein
VLMTPPILPPPAPPCNRKPPAPNLRAPDCCFQRNEGELSERAAWPPIADTCPVFVVFVVSVVSVVSVDGHDSNDRIDHTTRTTYQTIYC